MTKVGTWDPDAPPAASAPDMDFLRRAIALCQSGGLDTLESALSPTEQQRHAVLMQRDENGVWDAVAEHFTDDELRDLIRFFTVAEMRLPGWRADAHSPVIALARTLRRRSAPLDRELTTWIRSQSDNRYLPWGAVPG